LRFAEIREKRKKKRERGDAEGAEEKTNVEAKD
jgi:hypothetical protein